MIVIHTEREENIRIISCRKATSKIMSKVHGDADGTAGGNYTFSFTTQEPTYEISVSPAGGTVAPKGELRHTVTITNGCPRAEDFTISEKIIQYSNFLRYSLSQTSFHIEGGGSATTELVVSNSADSCEDVSGDKLKIELLAIGAGMNEAWAREHQKYVEVTDEPNASYFSPPSVVSAEAGASIDTKVTITFSTDMDMASVEGALTCSFAYTTSWSGEKTIVLTPSGGLDYCHEYQVSVGTGARSKTCKKNMEQAYTFSFTTEPPPFGISITPPFASVKKGKSASAL